MKSNIVKQLLLCLILVASCLISRGQEVACYFSGDFVVDAGSTFTADIQVDSFTNMGGYGFSINWDPTVLAYKGVSYALEGSEFGGINDTEAQTAGKFGFVWLSKNATEGTTLADSSVVLSIDFEVIGGAGDTTSLRFTDTPVPSEFYTPIPTIIPAVFTDAAVMVTGTSNTYYNSAPDKISLYPPVPNPFHDNTVISFDLKQAAQASMRIIDLSGKVIYENQQFFSAGMQNIPINKDIFSQSGTYYCLLNANSFRIIQKLVYIDR